MDEDSEKKVPRIVVFDLETLPNLPEALKVWPQLTGRFPGDSPTLKAQVSSIICFGYKFHGEAAGALVKSAWDFPESWESDVNDDRELCKYAYDILKDADVVVTQNGRSFDWKFLQTRLVLHDLPTLPKIIHVDTKVLAKSNLLLISNSLKNLGVTLTDDEKMENDGWPLWVGVHGGVVRKRDEVAEQIMSTYCAKDVEVTDKVFSVLKKFANILPNMNMYRRDGVQACPNCGGHHLRSEGTRTTKTRFYRRHICRDCGTWSFEDLKERLST